MLRSMGWRAVGGLPEARKLVVVAGPHTSNWDGLLLMLLGIELRADLRWVGKKELFVFPFAGLMRWFGGVPVVRSKKTKQTDQIAEYFRQSEALLLVIPPEGTRGRVERWKTGFYRIAQLAEVPISMGFVDFATRTGGLGPIFDPAPLGEPFDSPRVEQDLALMREFYEGKQGKYPEQFGPVTF